VELCAAQDVWSFHRQRNGKQDNHRKLVVE
jgi:hypothetical protein